MWPVLRLIFSEIAAKAAVSVPPRYSTAAQITPPASKPDAFLHGDIWRHPHAVDRRPAGKIIDGHDGLQPNIMILDIHDFYRTKIITKAEHVFH
jgi:hypothetical protein